MRFFVAALLTALLPFSVMAADPIETEKSVVAWLNLVDQQKYEASWNDASPEFKKRIAAPQWIGAISKAREPLGAVSSRKLDKVMELKSLPGLPDGDYKVMQFQTSFANKAAAVETITLIPDGDVLKVAGYFVK